MHALGLRVDPSGFEGIESAKSLGKKESDREEQEVKMDFSTASEVVEREEERGEGGCYVM